MEGAHEQVGQNSKFWDIMTKNDIPNNITEPNRPNQNPSEVMIRELKKMVQYNVHNTLPSNTLEL